MYAVARTRSLKIFRRQVGNCTFHINSAYIGLEWIARGSGKPEELKIAWSAPNNPRQAADQARSFLHVATLSHVFNAIDTYLRDLADEYWLEFSEHQRDILRKSITKPNKEAYSISERFGQLNVVFDADAELNLAMIAALAAWRNQLAHAGRPDSHGRLRLDPADENRLTRGKEALSLRYPHFDTELMLENIRARTAPKRKEIVALVSASQKLVSALDAQLVKAALPTVALVLAFGVRTGLAIIPLFGLVSYLLSRRKRIE